MIFLLEQLVGCEYNLNLGSDVVLCDVDNSFLVKRRQSSL